MLSKRDLFPSKLASGSGKQRWNTCLTAKRRRHVHLPGQHGKCASAVEVVESRLLLSASPIAHPTYVVLGPATPNRATPAAPGSVKPAIVAPLEPAQMQEAYGLNQVYFGSVQGTGAGQTIAIIDAYNDPDIISDANTFNTTFGLQPFNVTGGPTLKVLNETGGTSLPTTNGQGWDLEESLDVEWAHSVAPGANIILFEANTNSFSDLLTAEQTAAATAGVSAVSNSWASGEFSGEQSFDSYFVAPSGNQGVTFLASTGDDGAPAGYPAYSSNVVAVGGASLYLDTNGDYQGEEAWSGGGGGVSAYESQPGYQTGKVNGTSSTFRTAPDVSLDADPNTGVYVLDSYAGGWYQVGGTSLSCPMMAGLVAVANQGRVLNGLTTLNGASQTLPLLYNASSADFHDITTGNNGFPATTGYDLATGLGSPVANDLLPALAGYQSPQPAAVSAPLSASVAEDGTHTFASTISATDAAASGSSDSVSLSVINGTVTLKSTSGLTFTSGTNDSQFITVTGTLQNLNAALVGLVYAPSSGYTGADYLQVSFSDANDHETGWASVNLTVTPAKNPSVQAPKTDSMTENTTLPLTIGLTDASASGTSDSLTITAKHGTLTLASTTGLTFASGTNDTSSMTINGTLANLKAAVNGLVYAPTTNYHGSDTVVLTFSNSADSLSGTARVSVTVNAPPTITSPATASVVENTPETFSTSNSNAIAFTDTSASGTSDSLTLTVKHGSLALGSTTGLTFSSGANNSSSLTVTGTVANLNVALAGLVYTPKSGYLGTDSLKVAVANSIDGLSRSHSIAITVAAGPNSDGSAATLDGLTAPDSEASPDTTSTLDGPTSQWAAVTAAMEVLYG